MRFLVFAAVAAVAAFASIARTPTSNVYQATAAWSTFLKGQWNCHGGFPNGRSLDADIEFTPVLGGRWLQYHHRDRAPGQYEVLALLGPIQDDSTRVTALFNDNGGGARRFNAAGWVNGALTLLRDSTDLNSRRERFTFRNVSDSTLWFAWELQRGNVTTWQVGDSLTCARRGS